MPAFDKKPRTLYDKVFDDHIVDEKPDGTILLYIGKLRRDAWDYRTNQILDRHLVHEVTSPQAFEGLRNAGRKVRRPDCTLATTDHVSRFICASLSHWLTLVERPYRSTKEFQERLTVH